MKKILISSAFVIAVAIDLALNIASMWAISPPMWFYKAGFIGIAFLMVLFAVKAWIDGNKYLWATLAFITLFFDLSFILAATAIQSENAATVITIETDSILQEIRSEIDKQESALTELKDQFDQSVRGSTIDSTLAQQEAANAELVRLRTLRDERIALIESGELTEAARRYNSELSAQIVFYAIPAAFPLRLLEIIIWSLVFGSLQVIIVSSASSDGEQPAPVKKEMSEVPAPEPAPRVAVSRKRIIDFIESISGEYLPTWQKSGFNKDEYTTIIGILRKIKAVENTGGHWKRIKKVSEIVQNLLTYSR